MKILAFVISGILFLITHLTHAQSPVVFKYKNNPTYSIHNYKQPHNAALARIYKLDLINTFEYVKPAQATDKANRNYKAQAGRAHTKRSGGLVPRTHKKPVNGINSPANYKQQFK